MGVADAKGFIQLHEAFLGAHDVKTDRKARGAHLVPQHSFKTVERRMEIDADGRIVGGAEKGQALDMVPVEMGKEHPVSRRLGPLFRDGDPQFPYACPRIEYQHLVAFGPDLDAGSVAAYHAEEPGRQFREETFSGSGTFQVVGGNPFQDCGNFAAELG